ncbi:MAG: hypothetical protein GF421_12505 [Candidatus Aminicenantes bacterium]|nr:hypothetical protein [Candidatus Aminicenantes bacterium]
MEKRVKLKPVQVGMWVFTLALTLSVLLAWIFFGSSGFYWTFGSIQFLLALMHFFVLLRTRYLAYLIPVGMYFLWGMTFLHLFEDHPWHTYFAGASAVLLFAFIFVLVSKRINWRFKEILELAAKPVKGTADGFSHRPFPAGSADFTGKDVVGLARYLKKYVVVFPFIESDRVVLVIPEYMWLYMVLFRNSYQNETYVAFENSGNVTVRIARRDYEKYKQELTFDHLCGSLGELFKQFVQWYMEGIPEKILDRLNST